MMNYIDTHAHIFPPKVAEKVVCQLKNYYGLHCEGDGTIDGLLRSMDASGVDRAVVFSGATTPDQVETINRYVADVVAAHPDRLIGLGAMHRDYAKFADEFQWMRDHDLRGVKFHPDFQNFDIDDPAMFDIYRAAADLVLLFHVGDKQSERSAPEKLARVLDELPQLRVIAAHMGGYSAWERAKKSLIGRRNVWLDTSSTIPYISPEEAAEIGRMHGLDRVLFASDYPAKHHANAIADVKAMQFAPDEEEQLFHRNAETLFALD